MPANNMMRSYSGATASAASNSKKRKLDSTDSSSKPVKFYAVRAGHKPGVYNEWSECQANIVGFPGASFKSFDTQEKALSFMAGRDPEPNKRGTVGDKFYAVARGNFTGIFTNWDDAKQAINGAKMPKYKKLATREEAVHFIMMYGGEEAKNAIQAEEEASGGGRAAKRLRTAEEMTRVSSAATTTAAADRAFHDADDELTVVYTDGSSLSNGKKGAAAGFGVWFGPGDRRNVSERLPGSLQTNQRAELSAILWALRILPNQESCKIVTDSKYSIDCVTNWYRSWQRNGWKTSSGEDVKNRDLVEAIRNLIEAREKNKCQTEFRWVKGHAASAGNVEADRLAVQGARKKA